MTLIDQLKAAQQARRERWNHVYMKRPGYVLGREAEDAVALAIGFLEQMVDAASVVVANAEIAPDPTMKGATDWYGVPPDDIDQLRTSLELVTHPKDPRGPVRSFREEEAGTFDGISVSSDADPGL